MHVESYRKSEIAGPESNSHMRPPSVCEKKGHRGVEWHRILHTEILVNPVKTSCASVSLSYTGFLLAKLIWEFNMICMYIYMYNYMGATELNVL